MTISENSVSASSLLLKNNYGRYIYIYIYITFLKDSYEKFS